MLKLVGRVSGIRLVNILNGLSPDASSIGAFLCGRARRRSPRIGRGFRRSNVENGRRAFSACPFLSRSSP
jgi:hypothetical protein